MGKLLQLPEEGDLESEELKLNYDFNLDGKLQDFFAREQVVSGTRRHVFFPIFPRCKG